MRYIDADKLQKDGWKLRREKQGLLTSTYETMELDCVPTADVVEVVRCKDCIYKEECGREVLVNEYDNDKAVDITGFLFYCSYGERAEK